MNPPVPFPSSTVTVLLSKFAVARSTLPSALKSPATTQLDPPLTATGLPVACVNPPVPFPSSTVTVLSAVIRYSKITATVAVEIRHCYVVRLGSNRERAPRRRCESARTIAQQYCYIGAVVVGYGKILNAVPVEIPHSNKYRARSRRKWTARGRCGTLLTRSPTAR